MPHQLRNKEDKKNKEDKEKKEDKETSKCRAALVWEAP